MAKFATQDTNFAAASAEASSTRPVHCGVLKKGGLVVLKVAVMNVCCVCACVPSVCVGMCQPVYVYCACVCVCFQCVSLYVYVCVSLCVYNTYVSVCVCVCICV